MRRCIGTISKNVHKKGLEIAQIKLLVRSAGCRPVCQLANLLYIEGLREVSPRRRPGGVCLVHCRVHSRVAEDVHHPSGEGLGGD